MSGYDDAKDAQRDYRAPYTSHHPIPTIQKYREEKETRLAEAASNDDTAYRSSFAWSRSSPGSQSSPPATQQTGNPVRQHRGRSHGGDESSDEDSDGDDEDEDDDTPVDTSEANPVARNPKHRRKGLLKGRDERAEREVTDPVTHLPVRISDFTTDALNDVDENLPAFGTTPRTATGLSNKTKDSNTLGDETHEMQKGHESMNALFPPPHFDAIREELIRVGRYGITMGLAGSIVIIVIVAGLERLMRNAKYTHMLSDQDRVQSLLSLAVSLIVIILGVVGIWAIFTGVRIWMSNRVNDLWHDRVWKENRQRSRREAREHGTETVTWLNMLMGSIWPLINPDLFTSLADTLEDVMQASLPSLIQMVSVDDIGQGRENLRILGIRWLPTGAASRSVGADGKLGSAEDSKQHNDREVPGEGEVDDKAESTDDGKKDKQKQKNGQSSDDGTDQQVSEVRNGRMDPNERSLMEMQGMEAEEGDFVNLEIAFAYRARSTKTSEERAKDMHLYLAFYLPGNIKIPIWVNVRGIIGTVRVRMQLAPDPPFVALCTLTFLGQPKVDIGCIPLVKRGLNIMDFPLISNFVQSSIDAAMAQYVAPKSLTLDLKDMLAGDDFKKDTSARGVVVVYIKRGYDFKFGDVAIPMISDGKSDPYVSVGWAKFGKPLWSTRVLISEMEPVWQETAYILVTQEELNVDERLRVQLWDSDRFTADDDLGRIEVDLKKIMKDEASNGKMCDRTDGFRALKAGENMPGKLEWSVGYFSKCRIQKCQLEKQTFDPEVRSSEQLEQKVDQICRRKLREANIKEGRHDRGEQEFEQQKAQESKMRQDAMIISAPPPDDYPSGIFSIQIHQITGLEFEKLNKRDVDKDAGEVDEFEEGEGLPSSYCNIILNHSKIFRTRTKPKNARPFHNAGTERFISDWRKAEVFIAVRDARVGEDDPLLGIVHLQLGELFRERSQVNGVYPLTGGVGYGRIRLSMVWRSVQLQVAPEALGWDFGTVEMQPSVSMSDVPENLKSLKLKFYTDVGHRKMHAKQNEQVWSPHRSGSIRLPVRKRYSSCLAVQFKSHGIVRDRIVAFAILWLKDISDDEEREITLPVWRGDFDRARSCCLDDYGEKVGSIRLKLTFWSGLGEEHKKWAGRDTNLRDVFEVLDTAHDNSEIRKTERAAGIVDPDVNDVSDDSSDDDDAKDKEEDEAGKGGKIITSAERKHSEDAVSTETQTETDDKASTKDMPDGHNSLNLIEQAREYKKHAAQEHRRNRGVMQYKASRTAKWGMGKAGRAESMLKGIFSRHTREPGVETEV